MLKVRVEKYQRGGKVFLRRSFEHFKLLNITIRTKIDLFVIDLKVLKQKVFVTFSLSFSDLLALSSFC